ncbi:hypothetical protein [uncultured Tateyamaria sp.]|uniref:hypothetical protein n=1 Tax=uncultured Tateyamaria sp. TaxID=455651 RepID=UPI0026180DF6|nr:hypothetical protein [uncultured Tateyamaria sp.]
MMTRRTVLTRAMGLLSIGPLWAATPSLGMGAGTASPVTVTCEGAGDAALHAALCDRLHTALRQRHPDQQFTLSPAPDGARRLTLRLSRVTGTALTGALVWTQNLGGGTRTDTGTNTVTGPSVTAGTRDKKIGGREQDMLLKALLKTTDLPL